MGTVVVIGAGVSGLTTATAFLADGHDVTVLEQRPELGGVWAAQVSYPGLTTQSPRDQYALAALPMPADYPRQPGAAQVQAYLADYAGRSGVLDRIRYGVRVDSVARDGDRWTVCTADGDTTAHDLVVVCNGAYSTPYVPDLPGLEGFTAAGGLARHGNDFADAASVAGRRVVVVGAGKSAMDLAAAAAATAASVTLLFRRPLWKVPEHFGKVPVERVVLSRLNEYLAPHPQHPGAVRRAAHLLGGPALRLAGGRMTAVLDRELGLRRFGLMPDEPLPPSLGCNLSVMTPEMVALFDAGRIVARRGEIARLVPGAAELRDGDRLDTDAVLFGTGFRQEVPFLGADVQAVLRDEHGDFRLHRQHIHPDLPGLLFNGYATGLFSQLHSEIGAYWLVEHVAGRIPLPPRETMLAEVDARLAWRRSAFPNGYTSGCCVTPHDLEHIDRLLRDMGLRTRRLGLHRPREVLGALDPSWYAGVPEELAARRSRTTPASADRPAGPGDAEAGQRAGRVSAPTRRRVPPPGWGRAWTRAPAGARSSQRPAGT